MKVTKFAQSCFLIETSKNILIDPGNLVSKEIINSLNNIDIILITHVHDDHCFIENVETVLENNGNNGILILANEEVAQKLSAFKVEMMKEGDKRKIGKLTIEMVKAVHGYHPWMKQSGFPKQANGFMISDEGKKVYHCGDTLAFQNEYKADVVLVPICGNGVVMEPAVAVEFCLAINPKWTIPMHYDGTKHPQGTELFEKYAKEKGLKYKILNNGETLEI